MKSGLSFAVVQAVVILIPVRSSACTQRQQEMYGLAHGYGTAGRSSMVPASSRRPTVFQCPYLNETWNKIKPCYWHCEEYRETRVQTITNGAIRAVKDDKSSVILCSKDNKMDRNFL